MTRTQWMNGLASIAFLVVACASGTRNPTQVGGDRAAAGVAAAGSTSATQAAGAATDADVATAVGAAGSLVIGAAGGAAGNGAVGTAVEAAGAAAVASAGSAGAAGNGGCAAPIDLGVHFIGRVDGCVPDAVRFAWSGSGFAARFTGTGLSARIKGEANQFTLVLDGTVLPKFVTQSGDNIYPLVTDLELTTHTLELYRRTEANVGTTSLLGITVESGQLETPPIGAPRRLELVGDSISCGYGNEGLQPCGFSADTENHYLSYGPILARSLGAELSTVAWSGKGVARNYGGNQLYLMPLLYDRAVPAESRSVWSFSIQPDLVIINLGTNDFSGSTDPAETEFVAAYQDFLAQIRAHYPVAYILCTVGPMLTGNDLTAKARPYIAAAVAARRAAGDLAIEAYEMTTGNPNPGCDSHPSLLTHAAMADELATRIKTALGW